MFRRTPVVKASSHHRRRVTRKRCREESQAPVVKASSSHSQRGTRKRRRDESQAPVVKASSCHRRRVTRKRHREESQAPAVKVSSRHCRHVTRKRCREESQDPPEAPNIKMGCITEEERQIHKRLAFQWLLESKPVQRFLHQDINLYSSDKYLLAMVQCYFLRAGLSTAEYTVTNFFAALSLAIGMEEDGHHQITLPFWAGLSRNQLHKKRDLLLVNMEYRGYVSREECDQIMAEDSAYWAWTRQRTEESSDSDSHSVIILD